ncbi:Tryptophan biosynthesis protein TrpCF [Vibrio aerogenes CECT 7868]|uniref:Multifunctional fusion protein n=1 Tax=Vibrio aerogenes CECT 7868 TaxID=1216006 RepID=A0A1M6DMP1_9VIBR|nr:bifunctional indole-3-glycerol-phosphate synthase TrpC/phosphoribosylanthranilate isomerase TrpF [Vibrio aerogenes]SHI74574.1 Tryptophan biosynthesis protein TrpCF [Vibrio aerogenes CECT 7868]
MDKQLSEHISTRHTDMAEVLTRIVKDKKCWLEARMAAQPLATFKDELSPSDRSFYDALNTGKTAFILECKKASPSKGLIREDFNLDEIASVYRNHANAISVLTDEKYFQGNLEFLPRIRNQVTQPVLCKDFMLAPYQVSLARYYGADAILLMLSVLDDEAYREMADVAHSLNMGVLTEVSNEAELERALALEAKVIGINNRNLRDLTTDLDRTRQLAPKIPEGITIISESGIYTNQQVRDLSQYANGFLIGSSLMAEEDLELAVRRVTLGENKVCGLTRAQDAAQVWQAGAVYGGLIFVKASPRYVTPEQARTVIAAAPLKYVGVFRDMPVETIGEIAHQLSLSAVQLHGHEDQAYVNLLRSVLDKSIAIWKAYGVGEGENIPEPLEHHTDRHLYDTKSGNQSGGTGLTFDWTQLSRTKDVMLAGGLSPDNAQQAASLGCTGLDFNSGVESAPGLKDPEKIQQAFQQIRNY